MIDGCDERHWSDVKDIMFSAVRDAGMDPQLVSDDVEIGIIHKRIVQNIYDNSVVICDVSAKNPNVMLELGMRLAFDKPVIVVKDDKTSYSFDASPIEHLTYPRDLRFQSIVSFQIALADKVKAMRSSKNENSFLKSFGTFKVAKLDHEAGSPLDLVLEELSVIKSSLRARGDYGSWLNSDPEKSHAGPRFLPSMQKDVLELCLRESDTNVARITGAIKALRGVVLVTGKSREKDHIHLSIHLDVGHDALIIRKRILTIARTLTIGRTA